MKHRRAEDKCWIKRMYVRFTPYVQAWGWATLAIPIAMALYGIAPNVNAAMQKNDEQDQRLTKIEQNQAQISGKLDTIIYFVKRK